MKAYQGDHTEDYSWIRILSAMTLLLIFMCSLLLNLVLLCVLRKRNLFLLKGNRFVGFLLTVELVAQVFGVPLVLSSMVAGRWLFGQFGCIYYAFLMTMLGIMSISFLSVISVERCLIMFPQHPIFISKSVVIVITCTCTLYGLTWAIVPLSGWSEYVFEPSGLSCSPSWAPKHSSFVMTIFIAAFGIPFTCMVICYGTILWKVRTINQSNVSSQISDKELAKTMALIMASFLICWVPYAVFSGLGTFGFDMSNVPPEVTLIPLTCAKIAGLVDPILYGLKHSVLRKEILKVCKRILFRRNTSDLATNNYNLAIEPNNIGQTSQCEPVNITYTNGESLNHPLVINVASRNNADSHVACHPRTQRHSENDGRTAIYNSIFPHNSVVKFQLMKRYPCDQSLKKFTPRPATVESHSV